MNELAIPSQLWTVTVPFRSGLRVPSTESLHFSTLRKWSGRGFPAAARADQEIPGSPNRDPDSRFPAESGNGPIPDSRFPADRESGIGKSPKKPGKRGIRFPIPD